MFFICSQFVYNHRSFDTNGNEEIQQSHFSLVRQKIGQNQIERALFGQPCFGAARASTHILEAGARLFIF